LGVVHDLISRALEHFLKPSIHNFFVKIAAAKVSNRYIPGPVVHGDGVADDFTVSGRPSGPVYFQVRVFRLDVDCDFFRPRKFG